GGDEEVVVLEVAEDGEVPRQREDEKRLPLGRRPRAPDPHRQHLVPEGAAGQQEDETPVPPAVEDVARDDDERPPAMRPRHRQPRERQDDKEEEREGCGGEEQARGSLRSVPGARIADASRSTACARRWSRPRPGPPAAASPR